MSCEGGSVRRVRSVIAAECFTAGASGGSDAGSGSLHFRRRPSHKLASLAGRLASSTQLMDEHSAADDQEAPEQASGQGAFVFMTASFSVR